MWHYTPSNLNHVKQHLLNLLTQSQTCYTDINSLSENDHAEFIELLSDVIDELNGQHLHLMSLMGFSIRIPAKKLIWENNHLKITNAIASALSENGRMPGNTYIARITGLSRQTVQAHLENGDNNSLYVEHLNQYTKMAPVVMDMVLNRALYDQDMKASKLYFEILEKMRGPNAPNIYNTQNNYIQINNTVIKQEAISHLSPEQLKQVEEIFKPGMEVEGGLME